MADIQPINHAPIKEALIDVRSEATASMEEIASAQKELAAQYPHAEKITRSEIEWTINAIEQTGSIEHQNCKIGYKYTSKDGKYIAQFRLDGFTFSRLEPYEKWDNMKDEALRVWNIYARIAKPQIITRIAVRYINALKIPFPIEDLNEYLVASPEVPKGLHQALASFLSRISIVEPSINAGCIFTQASEGVNQDELSIVLDIDAFKLSTFDANELDFWHHIEDLHKFKNDVFFKSITNKMIGLLQ